METMNLKHNIMAISGVKNSGKTTMITKLLEIFNKKGLKTAVIKHDGHSYMPDPKGTDTDLFNRAGAHATIIFDREKYTLTKREKTSIYELILKCQDSDIIILEGFKDSAFPKLELIREINGKTPVCDPEKVIAYITDFDYKTEKPHFSFDESREIAEFILNDLKVGD